MGRDPGRELGRLRVSDAFEFLRFTFALDSLFSISSTRRAISCSRTPVTPAAARKTTSYDVGRMPVISRELYDRTASPGRRGRSLLGVSAGMVRWVMISVALYRSRHRPFLSCVVDGVAEVAGRGNIGSTISSGPPTGQESMYRSARVDYSAKPPRTGPGNDRAASCPASQSPC